MLVGQGTQLIAVAKAGYEVIGVDAQTNSWALSGRQLMPVPQRFDAGSSYDKGG